MFHRIWVLGAALSIPALAATTAKEVTFNKDVLPIMQKRCQGCHRPGEVAPMSFLTYNDARPWAKAIKEAVLLKKMPPWFADPAHGKFENDRSLSQPETDTLVAWADGGAREGDPKDRPSRWNSSKGGPSASRTWCSICPTSSPCPLREPSTTSSS